MSDSVIIMGPTAVGKSGIAVDVAEKLNGEIVSADSMQIYRGLDIGTAKPPAELLARIPHHMIDVADPEGGYSVAKYRREAGAAVRGVMSRGRTPVIAGGTGLYLHSLLFDMDFGSAKGDAPARAEWERAAEERGKEYVYALLEERSPDAAKRIHPNNLHRVIRALERVSADGGAEGSGVYRPFGFDLRRGGLIDPAIFLLTRDRPELVRRIDERVDGMVKGGLAQEAERLMKLDLPIGRIAGLGIGYREMIGYLRGEYGRDEAIELIKIHTRRYAKRQMTWFKRYGEAQVINLSHTSDSEAVAEITKKLSPHNLI
ncbi:MAG: tRNA (adenosine(37)-N6)-dimethylallyltransferase MiaA [Clostridiales Family XIII bacterium]|jgi:tRNA dimethylallyltransferase|nr:tRNA (adenosine(37)-N6)-dimethylallyltransferase MiaA [Clostridiales Family XIII bacterium]